MILSSSNHQHLKNAGWLNLPNPCRLKKRAVSRVNGEATQQWSHFAVSFLCIASKTCKAQAVQVNKKISTAAAATRNVGYTSHVRGKHLRLDVSRRSSRFPSEWVTQQPLPEGFCTALLRRTTQAGKGKREQVICFTSWAMVIINV